ncbi:hypothetical protein N3K66_006901 [Trichothecium roseum]|uniref:Uncharacterized protein n=1 Tax=Trichothecium roseum TaxID=47278 RepID=A0ACC0UWP2_9HYPO|nr:hypothetical protein N3K66_006901 [Trichothecium roseum]
MAADPITSASDDAALLEEIGELEARLRDARARLHGSLEARSKEEAVVTTTAPSLILTPKQPDSRTHFLLLLADSALPLGSFAFSSGLESYLVHARHGNKNSNHAARTGGTGGGTASSSFAAFLPSSVSSLAGTTLPFVLAAHRRPRALPDLDDQLDAAVLCTVGRRASVAQGRALLGIWERSLRDDADAGAGAGVGAGRWGPEASFLRDFGAALRAENNNSSRGSGGTTARDENDDDDIPPATLSAHLGPLFGAVSAVVGLSPRQAAYVFVLGHVKALVSAAVRAGVFGPFQAQKVLAGGAVQAAIEAVVDREWDTPVDEAGQSVPVMDLWVGRHEVLYSRIFNS